MTAINSQGGIPWWKQLFAGDYQAFFQKPPEEIHREVDFIADALQLRNGMNILDVGCGPGRHALELAARKYRVTGIDISRKLIHAARRKAEDSQISGATFIRADMRHMTFTRAFDAAISVFTSFGYFSEADNERVIRNVASALRPGGRFLLDIINKDWLIANFQKSRTSTSENVTMTEIVDHFDPDSGIFSSTWIFERDGQETGRFTPTLKIYSQEEITILLEKCGFQIEKLMGDYTGSDFTPQSPRAVIVARKTHGTTAG